MSSEAVRKVVEEILMGLKDESDEHESLSEGQAAQVAVDHLEDDDDYYEDMQEREEEEDDEDEGEDEGEEKEASFAFRFGHALVKEAKYPRASG